MTKKFRLSLIWILLISILAACIPTSKSGQAQKALQAFFDALVQGDYKTATQYYGGSYETLVSFNPDIDPNDQANLWKMGCEVNGLKCLSIRTVTFNEITAKGEYIFTVEFNNTDLSLFVREACCGENPTTPPQFQFEYRVVAGGDGVFRVLDMPVYVP